MFARGRSMNAPTKSNKIKVGHIINVFSFVMCPIFFVFKEDFTMKKIKMSRGVSFTFEEGCNKYLENCRQRNIQGIHGNYTETIH